jgi:hypothetical protein
MIASMGHRRTTTPGGTQLLVRYAAGDSLANATFTRAGAAVYTQQVSDTLVRYQAGASLAASTFTRSGAATFNGNA